MSNYILVINPGSTSTKIGVFENDTLLFDKTLRHPAEEIAKFATIPDQKSWRKEHGENEVESSVCVAHN